MKTTKALAILLASLSAMTFTAKADDDIKVIVSEVTEVPFLDKEHYDVVCYDEDSEQYLFFRYDKENDGIQLFAPMYEILQYETGDYKGDLRVPDYVEYEGTRWKVTSIDAFLWSHVKTLEIPNTVVSIDGISDCWDLTTIKFHDWGIRKISGVIYSCNYLTDCNIPLGAEEVSEAYNKIPVEKIEFPYTLKTVDWSFRRLALLKDLDLGEASNITGSFFKCPSLKKVVIPQTMDNMEGSFNECPSLERVELPAKKITWLKNCFKDCRNINEIVLWADDPNDYGPSGFLETCFTAVDYANCMLYVPWRSVKKYREHDFWGKFGKIENTMKLGVEGISQDGALTAEAGEGCITVRTGGRPCEVAVYGADGHLEAECTVSGDKRIDVAPGIYIVKTEGFSRKVAVR